MTNETKNNTDFLVEPKHMLEWELKYGKIPNNTILLINFGWASRWSDKNSYLGITTKNGGGTCNFPGISKGKQAAIHMYNFLILNLKMNNKICFLLKKKTKKKQPND